MSDIQRCFVSQYVKVIFTSLSDAKYTHIKWVPVTKTWSVLRLQLEEMASRCVGRLGIYLISSFGQPTWDGPLAGGFWGD